MRVNFLQTVLGLSVMLIGVAACSDGTSGSGGSTTSSTSTGGTTAGGTGGTTAGGTGGTTTGGTGGATTGGTGGTTTSAPTYGYCTKPCGTVVDCCPAGSPDCPSNMYPNNWQCEQGACLAPECATTADCTATDPATDCLTVSGFHGCLRDCAVDQDCKPPATCAGVDDNGAKYCTVAGSGCVDDASCGGYGKCVDKLCVCTADADCTAAGFNKCSL